MSRVRVLIIFVVAALVGIAVSEGWGIFRRSLSEKEWEQWHGLHREGASVKLRSPLTINDVVEGVMDENGDDTHDHWYVNIREDQEFATYYSAVDTNGDSAPDILMITMSDPLTFYHERDIDGDGEVDTVYFMLTDLQNELKDSSYLYIDLNLDGLIDGIRWQKLQKESWGKIVVGNQLIPVVGVLDASRHETTVEINGAHRKAVFKNGAWSILDDDNHDPVHTPEEY